jgi:hypothetical protein
MDLVLPTRLVIGEVVCRSPLERDFLSFCEGRLHAFGFSGIDWVDAIDKLTAGRSGLLAGIRKRDAFVIGLQANRPESHFPRPAGERETKDPRLRDRLVALPTDLQIEAAAIGI